VVLAGYVGWQLLGPEESDSPTPAVAAEEARPSIAVLAFDNMSDDPDREYFSDGITEDLITDLAKISGLQVTARNTTFAYKGQAVDVAAVGRELGVAYVVEGSVRQADGRVRINAQLIETTTGAHVWADRYDRAMEDIFAVQDDVVEKIVEALRVTLTGDEEALLAGRATEDLAAYDMVKRAWWLYHRFNMEDNQRARALFEQAAEADPRYADALTGLGFTYYEEWAQFWVQDVQHLETAGEMARASLALDPNSPAAYTLLSHAYLWTRQHDRALEAMETGLALDPDDAYTQRDMAELLLYSGQAEEAVGYARRAMELDPHYVASFPFTLAFAYHLLDRHEEAIDILEDALDLNPLFMPSMLLLAGSHIALGNQAEAQRYAAQALAINPQLRVDLLASRMPFRDPSLWNTRAEMMRSAGIP
jgi:adenylate cyclase